MFVTFEKKRWFSVCRVSSSVINILSTCFIEHTLMSEDKDNYYKNKPQENPILYWEVKENFLFLLISKFRYNSQHHHVPNYLNAYRQRYNDHQRSTLTPQTQELCFYNCLLVKPLNVCFFVSCALKSFLHAHVVEHLFPVSTFVWEDGDLQEDVGYWLDPVRLHNCP